MEVCMRKEEDENTPDLGPIEDYLHAVATERKLPSLAVGICTLRIEDAAPKLRACWTGQRTARSLSDDEGLLLFRRIHIPGAARDSQACRPILRSLRLPFQDLDDLLGDAVAEKHGKDRRRRIRWRH
jgi:hypothetical protein